ncbi:MAG: hypothetical protein J5892_01235 [Bacilli bacterium]|nr:hypothetical protein [Bacilli bacterium]
MDKRSRCYKLLVVLLMAMFLTGCRRVKQYISTDDMIVKFKSVEKYDIKYDTQFYRTIREVGMIVGPDFKIGFEQPTEIKNEKEFEKLKGQYKDQEDFKEVKYSGYEGFMFYTAPYIRYEIYLNIDNKHVLRLNIYSANDPKEFQTKALNSKEVQYILKHLKVKFK